MSLQVETTYDGVVDLDPTTMDYSASPGLVTANWSTSMTQTNDSSSDEYADVIQLIRFLDLYLVPLIVIVGTVGNILSFLVFTATYLRRLSSSVYLAAVAIVDTVFLISLLFTWLPTIGIQIVHRPGWCQLFVYASYVSSFLSVWFVVCFTFERYLIIEFPLKRQVLCRPRRAKIVVFSFTAIALVFYNFAFWTSSAVPLSSDSDAAADPDHDGLTTPSDDNVQFNCQEVPAYSQLVTTIGNIDTLVTLIVPSALIIFSNVRISIALSRFYRELSRFYRDRQMLDRDCGGGDNVPTPTSSVGSAAARRSLRRGMSITQAIGPNGEPTIYANVSFNRLQWQVTKMLLIVSVVFLLLNIPSHLIRLHEIILTLKDPTHQTAFPIELAHRFTYYLFYVNFSANFLLYNASGRTFRRAMVRLGRRCANKARNCCWKIFKCRAPSPSLTRTRNLGYLAAVRHGRGASPPVAGPANGSANARPHLAFKIRRLRFTATPANDECRELEAGRLPRLLDDAPGGQMCGRTAEQAVN